MARDEGGGLRVEVVKCCNGMAVDGGLSEGVACEVIGVEGVGMILMSNGFEVGWVVGVVDYAKGCFESGAAAADVVGVLDGMVVCKFFKEEAPFGIPFSDGGGFMDVVLGGSDL